MTPGPPRSLFRYRIGAVCFFSPDPNRQGIGGKIRSKSLKDDFVNSHYTASNRIHVTERALSVTVQCQYIAGGQTYMLPDGTQFRSKHYTDRTTQGVVYLFRCPCGGFYIGKTICPLARRFYEHIFAAGI